MYTRLLWAFHFLWQVKRLCVIINPSWNFQIFDPSKFRHHLDLLSFPIIRSPDIIVSISSWLLFFDMSGTYEIEMKILEAKFFFSFLFFIQRLHIFQ